MRKGYKQKLRSCSLCKPHKAGWANRWKHKERQLIKTADAEIRDAAVTVTTTPPPSDTA